MMFTKRTGSSSRKRYIGILLAIFLLASYSIAVFAVAPTGGYNPGDTLDPDCTPGSADCFVQSIALDFDSPLVESGGTVSLPAASAGVDGYLSASDWNRFDGKLDAPVGTGTALQYLRGDNTWQTLDTSAVPENGNLYWTNGRFNTALAAATSAANLATVGTITSGVWQASQITDAYISDSITVSNYVPLAQKGAAGGVATLDGSGKVPSSQLSSFSLSDTFVVNSQAEMLNLLSAELGDVAIRLDENKSYILTTNDPTNVANWQQIITPLDFVLSVNGQYGAVNLTTSDISEGTNLYYTDARVGDYLNTVKGVANGVASLDANGKVPTSQLGSIILNETHVVLDIPAMLALTGVVNGDLAVVTSTSKTYVLADDNDPSNINSWVEIVNGSPVTSVNGQVGTVSLTTTNIAEGSNQYFTNTRARGAISATGPLTYNTTTGVLGITQANGSTNGYISAIDWNTFNNKQNALTFGNVTASANPEITITGGTSAVIGSGLDIIIPDASDTVRGLITTGAQNFAGIKTFADGLGVGDTSPSALFSVGVGGLFQVDSNGNLIRINNVGYSWPASQGAADSVLINDGSGNLSWGSNGVVTLNGLTDTTQTFTTSTSGSDFTISSSSGVHTFNFPTASATARGALSATKYTEFNNKPYVDTTYNNIYVSSLSGGTVMNGASGGINNIVMGYQAGDTLSTGNNNTLFGYQAGKSATSGVSYAFFAGYQAGLSATSATHSIFMGRQAGSGATSASYGVFIGRQAGQGATGASIANFIGDQAGFGATGATQGTFIGQQSGYQAISASYSNFIGRAAGYQATGATESNFIGWGAGGYASAAPYSNMIGRAAGYSATNATFSDFIGYQAGYGATNAANSIFIGKNAGLNDTVNNTVSGSSIAIGDSAGTGGFSNSIALGASAVNTAANQFLIGSTYTNFSVRGVNYIWPSAQAGGSGYVLTNDGTGQLSWATGLSIGGSNTQLQYNNNGNLGGISGVTFDGTNLDASDSVFRIVDNADTTKRAMFEVSGIDAATTRTYTFPNAGGTLALATGISGGQTIYGGTASGNDLTLGSTSNATKGKIYFGANSAYDETNKRLGIGTTSPEWMYEANNFGNTGNIYFLGMISSFTADSTKRKRIAWRDSGGTGESSTVGAIDVAYDGTSTNMYFGHFYNGVGGGYLTADVMTITGTGRVGIGTTTPTNKLDIAGGITFSSDGTAQANSILRNSNYMQINGGVNGFVVNNSANTANLFYVKDDGKVMIGGIAPSTELHVYKSAGSTLRVADNTFNVDLYTGGQAGIRFGLTATAVNSMMEIGSYSSINNIDTKGRDLKIFSTAGSSYMYMAQATGNIGVGTTSPSQPLHIVGNSLTTGNVYLKSTSNYVSGTFDMIDIVSAASGSVQSRFFYGARTVASIGTTSNTEASISFFADQFLQSAGSFRAWSTTANTIRSDAGSLIFTADSGLSGSGNAFTATERMRLTPTGYVGIGTSSPGAALEVIGASADTIRIGNTAGSVYYRFGRSTGTGFLTYRGTQSGFAGYQFENDTGVIGLQVDANGRVGIGGINNVTTTSAKLHIGAGTAAAGTAPLKLTSGTLLTTPEVGAFEYLTNNLYFTPQNVSTTHKNREGFVTVDQSTQSIYSRSIEAADIMNNNSLRSIYLGYRAGYQTLGMIDSIAIGTNALSYATGSANIGIGIEAGRNYGVSGTSNILIGNYSGHNATSGTYNVALGQNALAATVPSPMSGSYNVGIGFKAGDNISSGSNNVAIGKDIDFQSATADGQLTIQNIIFGTGNTGTGTTLSTGNIGIGVASPSFKLDVATRARIGKMQLGSWSVDTNYAFFGSDSFDQTAAGNYGLIQGSDGTYINTTSSGNLGLRRNNTNILYFPSGGGAQLFTGMGITTGGATVPVNTSRELSLTKANANPAAAFIRWDTTTVDTDILGQLQFNAELSAGGSGTERNGAFIEAQAAETWTSTSAATRLLFKVSPTGSVTPATAMTISSNGNTGIGTGTTTYRFNVSDTGTAGIVGAFTNSDGTCTLDPGDVSGWSCPSDINLKKNVEDLAAGTLDHIMQLRPVTYRLNSEDDSVELSTGLIAQEVQTVFPKLVKTQMDGTLSLNYGGLTPYVIKAIQEMNLQIVNINDMEKSNSWRDALIAWFENAANGIQKIFAREVHTETLCVGQTCLTETQVQQLLQVIGSQGVTTPPTDNPPTDGAGDTTSTDTTESGDTPSDSATGTDSTSGTPDTTGTDSGSQNTGTTDTGTGSDTGTGDSGTGATTGDSGTSV